jgi:hypothetical protein
MTITKKYKRLLDLCLKISFVHLDVFFSYLTYYHNLVIAHQIGHGQNFITYQKTFEQLYHLHSKTKLIWDVELIRCSVYSGSRNKILNHTRVTRFMPCVQYRYKGQMGNYAHDRYHGKVSSDHMTFSSLGWQRRIARC